MSNSKIQPIPKGYTQIEVGVIPNDWDVKRLGYITNSIAAGRSNTLSELGSYPIYGSTGIIGYKKYRDYQGDRILVARVGANAGIVNKVTGEYCVSDNTLMITCSESYDFNFSYYQLINYRLNRIIFGSGQPLITGSQLKNILVPLPPTKAEQAAIASVLSDTDALIESLQKLIAKKRAIKQGAMQELLTGKRRLPGFSGKWEVRMLKEVADMNSGGTPLTSKHLYYDGGIPWIVIADITKAGKYLLETEKTLSQEGLRNSSAKLFKKGTLFFAMYASIGKCTIAKMDTTCNQAILGIQAKIVDSEFLYYYLASREKDFILMGQTGTQNNLNKEIVQNLIIPYPSLSEQTAIATILSDLDTEFESLEEKLEKFKQIKQGMMQVLLTGKIRLPIK